MTKNEFVMTVMSYKGEVIEKNNLIEFISKNDLKHSYNIETEKGIQFITKIKKVACKFVFDEKEDVLTGEEETYEIIGGFSIRNPNKNDLIQMLERYNFKESGFISLWNTI